VNGCGQAEKDWNMKIAKVAYQGTVSYGIVEGDQIALVAGDLFDGCQRSGTVVALSEVSFEIPLMPRTFYAAGMNYVDHVIEQARIAGREPNIPQYPNIGYRANNALIAHNEAIIKPKASTELFQYEGELVAVIGKQAKNVTEAEALDYVFGYTIGNDVSERTWQNQDLTLWRAKNTDTFKPMGPWIETDLALDGLRTTIRLNGREVIAFDTNNMLFGVARYISAMSEFLTLYPGDVVWMGTEGKAENMVPGDLCEIEISGIGILSNPVIAEA
jgi:2-keto-4-pentenoate hydratase/2-oxohepta-3-ene-1,7-dioic acid hydratase in catechol pathway